MNNQVSLKFCGCYELVMHRFHAGKILLDNSLVRSASLVHIAAKPADKPYIVTDIDKDGAVQVFANLRGIQRENAVNNEDIDGVKPCDF